MKTAPRLLLLAACLLLSLAPLVYAQESGSAAGEPVLVQPETSPDPSTYGLSSSTISNVVAVDMRPPNSSVGWGTAVSGSTGVSLYQTSTTPVDWWASVPLPSGAKVTKIEMEACDTTTSGALSFGLAKSVYPPGTSANITAVGTTGTAATPGCAVFALNVTTPPTIQNGSDVVYVFVKWSGAFNSTLLVNVFRIYYNLQVSPAPSTATFPLDVPTTHPFFRFVEAMARSGLTGGCGSGRFCPDSPVTRGQMAVFMSVALGLHWAP